MSKNDPGFSSYCENQLKSSTSYNQARYLYLSRPILFDVNRMKLEEQRQDTKMKQSSATYHAVQASTKLGKTNCSHKPSYNVCNCK